MKKGFFVLFFVFVLLSNLFIVSNSRVVSSANDLESLQSGIDSLEETQEQIESLTDADVRNDYLKNEWGKILAKKPVIGPIIAFYDKQKLNVIFDPLFKYSVGMEPSITWLFLLTILIWIVFLVVVYQSIRYAGDYPGWTVVLVDIAFMCFIGIMGEVKRAAQFIIDTISVLTTWWVQLILGILVVVILGFMIYFSKYIKAFLLALKMRRKKQELEDEKESMMKSLKNTMKIVKKQSEINRLG